ncbi:hypothetical protein [Streptomyces sp. MUM 178J]|uniref:hypothetical protein n=1 Tax=Streptomyces sp. MUM 178J TaxID=2791991 RepID=UPI001F04047D|nr:hypothetical protein [Streptomyces sp. MUM 178J]WRQ82605.1 hypothetical protein I3F59_026430 [Streptomyces sp. MUM 178J]WRQ83177.1 hypothetical protein I3F59_029745 [Streptomyces sp. MUM 178J]
MRHTHRCRAAAVAVVALLLGGGALTACGDGPGDGYAAVAAPDDAPTATVPPTGDVLLVPLDEGQREKHGEGLHEDRGPSLGTDREDHRNQQRGGRTGGAEGRPPDGTSPDGTSPDGGEGGPPTAAAPSPQGSSGAAPQAPTPAPSRPSPPPTPAPSPPASPSPSPTPSAGPAELRIVRADRAPLDKRWCEKVTVEFRNTGGSAATSGQVVFGTHVIGALGIDWATVESARPLPAPIPPGAVRTASYTVCVDAWRVPPGMHVETRDISLAGA